MCQVAGFPRMMGVLTHLDSFRNASTLRRVKKTLKQRFWTDIYEGCKVTLTLTLTSTRGARCAHRLP